ncbi:hypothetical protein DL96DRAFT_1591968 [Flagelloscypha sp. PMI_526]|nr:hypothetical protein DL96DRAFT_1591968 [Flagelloscypha sp. PMI_526]
MSGHISFPGSSSSQHNDMEDSYYTPSFPSASTTGSGFVVNPLSSHPPRSARNSLISNGNASVYSSCTNEKEQATQEDDEERDLVDEEEEKVKFIEDRVHNSEVWKELFLSSNGRDKAFKLIQYTLKTVLVFHSTLVLRRRPSDYKQSGFEKNILDRTGKIVSHLSLTRKQLLLFNWLYPLSADQSLKSKGFLHTLLHAPPPVLLELGLLGPKIGSRAARFSDWCWLFATLAGLVENGVEKSIVGNLRAEVEGRLYALSMSNPSATNATSGSSTKGTKHDEKELRRLQREEYWYNVTRMKLLCDLVFVSYDLFPARGLRSSKNIIQALTGMGSAILSSAKLYDKHKTTIVKAALRNQ